MPYYAWSGELLADYHERTRVIDLSDRVARWRWPSILSAADAWPTLSCRRPAAEAQPDGAACCFPMIPARSSPCGRFPTPPISSCPIRRARKVELARGAARGDGRDDDPQDRCSPTSPSCSPRACAAGCSCSMSASWRHAAAGRRMFLLPVRLRHHRRADLAGRIAGASASTGRCSRPSRAGRDQLRLLLARCARIAC